MGLVTGNHEGQNDVHLECSHFPPFPMTKGEVPTIGRFVLGLAVIHGSGVNFHWQVSNWISSKS